jgi:hypothetical protein
MNFMFNLEDYETVEERLVKFWKDYPDGRIDTKLVEASASRFIVQAYIYRTEADQHPWSSGLAEETISGRGVNATSALENCETSAIGRCLASAGYATKGKRPSREEMAKVAAKQAVVTSIAEVKAKMAETATQYVPVVKESDPWTTWESSAPQTMETAVETVKSILGATTDKDVQRCAHGDMVWKTGTSKAGKPWGHWRCIGKILGEAERCEPIWYEIKPDGSWGKRDN